MTYQVYIRIINTIKIFTLPAIAQEVLLRDAVRRDRVTARRVCLVKILEHERSLTREQLVARVEGELGKECFGKLAWEDTFFRDMRVVKRSLEASGYKLVYHRSRQKPGYALLNQPALSAGLASVIDGSVREVDPAQLAICSKMTPEQRFYLGCSMSDTSRGAVIYRTRQRYPELNPEEIVRLAIQPGN